MKVKSIRICNFKSFNDCTIHFNNFNVLIGANASGKSNFVEIFRLIKNIEQYGLENAISLAGGIEYFRNVQLGANQDFLLEIVFDHGIEATKTIDKADNILIDIQEYCYKVSLVFDEKNLDIKEIKEDILTHKINIIKQIDIENEYEKLGQGEITIINHLNGRQIELQVPEMISDFINANDEFSGIYFEKRNDIFLLLETPLFWRFYPFYSPRRFSNIGIFDFDPKLPKKASTITGKADLEEDGSNLAIVLNKIIRNPENNRKLSNLITDLLPFIDKLEIEKFADKSLMFKLKETYAKHNQYIPAAFMSDGTINIIALVVALYFEKEILTIIEEPERNIHPSLIGKIVQFMQDASQNKQIIVTTHNPEIVKNCNLEDLLLITRDEDGFSQISRPSDSEQVKIFLENEIGIEDLYIQNLLEIGQ